MNRTLRTSIVVAASVAAIAMASSAGAQPAPYRGDIPAQGGPALLVTTASVAPTDLDAALGGGGCYARLIGVTEAGHWLLYVPGAPAIANAGCPSLLANNTPFIVECSAEPTAAAAVQLIQQYIDDLDAHDYVGAYAAWEAGANPQSYATFVMGYQHPASVSVEIGTPGPIDAGAGQRYIEVPVVIHAVLDDGTHQTFEGSYTLHRTANIDGSTPRAARVAHPLGHPRADELDGTVARAPRCLGARCRYGVPAVEVGGSSRVTMPAGSLTVSENWPRRSRPRSEGMPYRPTSVEAATHTSHEPWITPATSSANCTCTFRRMNSAPPPMPLMVVRVGSLTKSYAR